MNLIKITAGDDTPYGFFSVSEFHPNSSSRMSDDDIGVFYVPEVLVEAGNVLRAAIEAPVYVNSSIRSKNKNDSVKGSAKQSMHLPFEQDGKILTRAVDFGISAGIKDIHAALLNNGEFAQELRAMGIGGIGLYDTFIHLDVGPIRMWDNRVSTKYGQYSPTIIYHNLMNIVKKKDEEEAEDLPKDLEEGFFRNPWFVFAVIAIVYYKFLRQ